MTASLSSQNTATRAAAPSGLYRAVWRWHFYAGLLVLPFLITLAVTGALYLFKDEIDGWLHADLKHVQIGEAATLPPSALVASALRAVPGVAVKYTDPPREDMSVEITVQTEDRGRLAVYIDPRSGEVLGSLPDRGTISWTIRYLHSLKFFGQGPRMLIEIVAGWTILLVATGVWLWWPRGQKGGVVTIRGSRQRRVFWRDLHAVTGIFVGGFIVFLALTGMPWSSVWGGKVNQWANGSNFGYPAGLRIDVPMSDEHLDHVAKTSWSLEQAQLPESLPPENPPGAMTMEPVGLDFAIGAFDALGLHPGYAVSLPQSASGVYSGSVYPDDLTAQRVVHLDQYSGAPLIDMSYGGYGPLGRGLEWGINTHMGQTYGLANQIVLLLACAGMVLLSVSAAVMWWKRRPSGSLGVPPLPAERKVFIGLFLLLGIGGLLFPLTGLSLVVMIGLDLLWQRIAARRPPTALG